MNVNSGESGSLGVRSRTTLWALLTIPLFVGACTGGAGWEVTVSYHDLEPDDVDTLRFLFSTTDGLWHERDFDTDPADPNPNLLVVAGPTTPEGLILEVYAYADGALLGQSTTATLPPPDPKFVEIRMEVRAVAVICSPGTDRCQDGHVVVCNQEGTAFELKETCANGCQDGRCKPETGCSPNTYTCVGADRMQCNASGTQLDWVETCTDGCDAGVCLGPCTPDTLSCSGNMVVRCDSSGMGRDVVATCPDSCRDGTCEVSAYVCDPPDTDPPVTLPDYLAVPLISIALFGASTLSVQGSHLFRVGDEILLVEMSETNTGSFELATVASISPTRIYLAAPLQNGYSTGSQVIRVVHFESLEIGPNCELTAPAWDGESGGYWVARVHANADIYGRIDMSGRGYRGGVGPDGGSGGPGGVVTGSGWNMGTQGKPGQDGAPGEGPGAGSGGSVAGLPGWGGYAEDNCASGGGGAGIGVGGGAGATYSSPPGGAGMNGASGSGGSAPASGTCSAGYGGSGGLGAGGQPTTGPVGCADFTSGSGCLVLGSGGGSGASGAGGGGAGCLSVDFIDSCQGGDGGDGGRAGDGGAGGGAVILFAQEINLNGEIRAMGGNGQPGHAGAVGGSGVVNNGAGTGSLEAGGGGGGAPGSGGGGGSGGLVWLSAPTITASSDGFVVIAVGGVGAYEKNQGGGGGNCAGGASGGGAAAGTEDLGGTCDGGSQGGSGAGVDVKSGSGGMGGFGRIKCDNTLGDCTLNTFSLPEVGSSEPI